MRRSAFTYCEDELPSRMDLGKHKYGGPFTTKEVEDVKAFWGILKILVCIGPAFMLQESVQIVPPMFSTHGMRYYQNISYHSTNFSNKVHLDGAARHIFISNGLLSPLLVVICIPLYLCLIRPCISYHIPGMLKRIGVGLALMVLSLVCSLAMDVVVHTQLAGKVNCMLSSFETERGIIISGGLNVTNPLYRNVYFFISQHFLSALLNIVFYVALLEFVCSQSPYPMKGLLLGFMYTTRYLFQALSVVSIVPFEFAWHIKSLSCGSGFYLMNIAVGALELVLFVLVARRYKYRAVSEPSNEYRYAEDYYSNIYSSQDNSELNASY